MDHRRDHPTGRRRIFISYSADSPTHCAQVRALADALGADGFDCTIDQDLVGGPSEGWPLWMEHQIANADFVLIVCSARYAARVLKRERSGQGKGATWEAHLIYQLLYESYQYNDKFVPVILHREDEGHIPLPLRSCTYYLATDVASYRQLVRFMAVASGALAPRQRSSLTPLNTTSAPMSSLDTSRLRVPILGATVLGVLKLAELAKAALVALGALAANSETAKRILWGIAICLSWIFPPMAWLLVRKGRLKGSLVDTICLVSVLLGALALPSGLVLAIVGRKHAEAAFYIKSQIKDDRQRIEDVVKEFHQARAASQPADQDTATLQVSMRLDHINALKRQLLDVEDGEGWPMFLLLAAVGAENLLFSLLIQIQHKSAIQHKYVPRDKGT